MHWLRSMMGMSRDILHVILTAYKESGYHMDVDAGRCLGLILDRIDRSYDAQCKFIRLQCSAIEVLVESRRPWSQDRRLKRVVSTAKTNCLCDTCYNGVA